MIYLFHICLPAECSYSQRKIITENRLSHKLAFIYIRIHNYVYLHILGFHHAIEYYFLNLNLFISQELSYVYSIEVMQFNNSLYFFCDYANTLQR